MAKRKPSTPIPCGWRTWDTGIYRRVECPDLLSLKPDDPIREFNARGQAIMKRLRREGSFKMVLADTRRRARHVLRDQPGSPAAGDAQHVLDLIAALRRSVDPEQREYLAICIGRFAERLAVRSEEHWALRGKHEQTARSAGGQKTAPRKRKNVPTREALLVARHGQTLKELAAQFGCAVSTLKRRLHKSR